MHGCEVLEAEEDIGYVKRQYCCTETGTWLPSSVNDKENTLHCLNNMG